MADARRVSGEHVKCYQCYHAWPRAEGGLQCPNCQSEFVEIISDSDPPSPEMPPLSDDSHPSLNRSRSLESLERSPWNDMPDPARADLDTLPNTQRGRPVPGGYLWESTSPNGSSSVHVSVSGFGGGPVPFPPQAFRGRGRTGDPTMTAVNQDFENLVGSIMGLNPSNRRNRPAFVNPHHPAFDPRPWRHDPPQESGLFGMLGSLFGGTFTTNRGGPGPDMAANPITILQHLLNAGNGVHGDAVGSQEALDRIITQMMEQNHSSNAPPPASEAAIQALRKKSVDKDMMDDKGNAECSICMDSVELGDQVTVLPCSHWFHETCITVWLKEHDTCPHCRKSISPPSQSNSAGGSGGPSRTPRRRSQSGMPGSWQDGPGTSRGNPFVVHDSSPTAPDSSNRHHHSSSSRSDRRRSTSGSTHSHSRSHRHDPSTPSRSSQPSPIHEIVPPSIDQLRPTRHRYHTRPSISRDPLDESERERESPHRETRHSRTVETRDEWGRLVTTSSSSSSRHRHTHYHHRSESPQSHSRRSSHQGRSGGRSSIGGFFRSLGS